MTSAQQLREVLLKLPRDSADVPRDSPGAGPAGQHLSFLDEDSDLDVAVQLLAVAVTEKLETLNPAAVCSVLTFRSWDITAGLSCSSGYYNLPGWGHTWVEQPTQAAAVLFSPSVFKSRIYQWNT